MTNLNLFLSTWHVVAFDNQLHFSELVGDAEWRLDPTIGVLSIREKQHWQVQILGTEFTGSWEWAWANSTSKIPEQLLQAALTLKEFGREYDISEFTSSTFPLERVTGHPPALRHRHHRIGLPRTLSVFVLERRRSESTAPQECDRRRSGLRPVHGNCFRRPYRRFGRQHRSRNLLLRDGNKRAVLGIW
jgi:hypothetical protein